MNTSSLARLQVLTPDTHLLFEVAVFPSVVENGTLQENQWDGGSSTENWVTS